MKRLDPRPGEVRLSLSRAELLILNNALNEVYNGVDIEDWEFPVRLGVQRAEARGLLAEVSDLIESLPDDG